ncbi:MAG: hypothetical protein HY431_00710, partial [Candidatus Levybacteria bacterium]|nr:hypothetical protein [Candidatus Levybacteria bacterium]
IDDGGNLGFLSVEGSVLDIDSLTFVAGGSILSTGANTLTLDSGNNIITFAADDTTLTASGLTTFNTAATLAFSGDITITGNDITNTTLNFGGGSPATLGTTSNSNLTITPNGTGDLVLTTDADTDVILSGFNANNNVLYAAVTTGVVTGVSTNTSGFCLTSGSTTPSWSSCAASAGTLWELTSGAISPIHTSVDVLIGSNATSSSKFAFINVLTGTPTATISANASDNATYLTGSGNLQTVRRNTLTLGGNTTGDVLIQPNGDTGDYFRFFSNGTDLTLSTTDSSNLTLNPSGTLQFYNSSSTIDSSGNLTIAGTLAVNGDSITSDGAILTINAGGAVDIQDALTADSLTLDTSSLTFSGVTIDITTGTNQDLTLSPNGTGDIVLSTDGDTDVVLSSFNANNNVLYGAVTTGVVTGVNTSTEGLCLVSGSSSPSWLSCSVSSGNLWQVTSGALNPIHTSVDLLLGSSATSSAKFGFLNVLTGTPTASISANSNNNATYLTGDGSLQTVRNNTLTLGGNTTGNITLSPNNGGAGSRLTINALTANFTGTTAINATSLGTLTTSSTLTLSGATALSTSLTSMDVGAAFSIQADNSYVRIGDSGTPTTATGDDDLFVTSDLETGGQATISGNLTLAGGLRTIATTQNNTLTIGGGTTGNIEFFPLNAGTGSLFTVNSETVTLAGTTTLNGTSLTSINGGATAINFNEFDVSATTGSVTIDDGGNLGFLSVEGTVLDVDSLTFVAAGSILSTGANTLTLDSGNNIITFAATDTTLSTSLTSMTVGAGFTIDSSSYVKIGDGATTPGSANGDDDLFVLGDLEVDGVLYTDGGIDTAFTQGSVVFAGAGGVLSQDNANFFFDDTSNELGIRTTNPTAALDVAGAASVGGQLTFRTGSGTIQTTSNNTLIIGGGSTGNIEVYPLNSASGSNFSVFSETVTLSGTTTLNGT